MPRLDATKAAFLVEKYGDANALPTLAPGAYTGTLTSVIPGSSQYNSGRSYWIWEFDVQGRGLPLYTEINDKPLSLLRLSRHSQHSVPTPRRIPTS